MVAPRENRSRRVRLRRAVMAGAVAAASLGTVAIARPAGAQAAYASYQWGLDQIHAQAAWASGTGTGVTIGIVDTGVDPAQQDLSGKIVASADCIGSNGNPAACVAGGADDEGHGTHVAGIAAARGIGVSGVAPQADLVVAKALDSSGSGTLEDVAGGIAWVVEHGARVVNLSIGSDPGFGGIDCVLGGCNASVLEAAADAAWNAGAIPVIAAGNNGGTLIAPAGYGDTDAVIVAATGRAGELASYSSQPGNAKWGIAAPGGDDNPTTPACGTADENEILSTYWTAADATNCYATLEGTSMATPFVTGTLALLLGRGLSPAQAVQVLLQTANRSVSCSGCAGEVDAGAAMALADQIGPPLPGPPPAVAPAGAGHTTGVSSYGGATRTGSAAAPATTSTAPPPAASPSATSSTTTPRLEASATGRRGHGAAGGAGTWIALLLVLGAAGVALLTERGRRRAAARGLEPVTVEAAAPTPPDTGTHWS